MPSRPLPLHYLHCRIEWSKGKLPCDCEDITQANDRKDAAWLLSRGWTVIPPESQGTNENSTTRPRSGSDAT